MSQTQLLVVIELNFLGCFLSSSDIGYLSLHLLIPHTMQFDRMTQQHHMNAGGQAPMMQMGMGGGQNTMNAMGRPNQIGNQGMNSQVSVFVVGSLLYAYLSPLSFPQYIQNQRSAELVQSLRRTIPNHQSGMYN